MATRMVRVTVTRESTQSCDLLIEVPTVWDEKKIQKVVLAEAERLDWDDDDPEYSAWNIVTAEASREADMAFDADGNEVAPSPPPPVEPDDRHWVSWNGYRWASDNTMALREDAPRPGWRADWRDDVSPEMLGHVMPATTLGILRADEVTPTHFYVARTFIREDGQRTAIQARIYDLFVGCEFRQGNSRLGTVYVHRDGEIIGAVMPLRVG